MEAEAEARVEAEAIAREGAANTAASAKMAMLEARYDGPMMRSIPVYISPLYHTVLSDGTFTHLSFIPPPMFCSLQVCRAAPRIGIRAGPSAGSAGGPLNTVQTISRSQDPGAAGACERKYQY